MEAQKPVWDVFASWLHDQRMARGWSKQQAADFAELSASTWSTLETAGRNVRGQWILPSPEDTTLTRIAKLFGVPASTVFELVGRTWVEPQVSQSVSPVEDRRGHAVERRLDEIERRLAGLDGLLQEVLRRLPDSNTPTGRARR